MPPKRKPGPQGPPAKRRKKTVADKDKKDRKSFLDLPAELRNDIYELALVNDTRIVVTRYLKEPNLLLTTHQIRAEARKIWYLRNTFILSIRDCDASVANAFQRHIQQFEVRKGGVKETGVKVRFAISGRKRWANLVKWCHEIHQHRLQFIAQKPDLDRMESVVAAAHGIVQACGDSGWERCLAALNAMRAAIVLLDKGWAKD
ncbi:hypothetical protein PRZ48_004755 [Zasmidium cellare]|uniref:Uncharacterized protein n=1 Tax=Zasmidium cellare TaxID=395010 RepID=A0ABR0EQR4_ZASCE|nr:hypothetical protein PRZ48_004755 [Zasmidium cellare]